MNDVFVDHACKIEDGIDNLRRENKKAVRVQRRRLLPSLFQLPCHQCLLLHLQAPLGPACQPALVARCYPLQIFLNPYSFVPGYRSLLLDTEAWLVSEMMGCSRAIATCQAIC